jgi:hypothetical protein
VFVEPLRVTAAILAAAATSATLFVAVDLIGLLLPTMGADSLDLALPHIALLWPASFIVALVHATGLGLPAFLVLRRLQLTAWWTSLIGGFAVGSFPYAILAFPWGSSPSPNLVEAGVVARFNGLHFGLVIAGLGLLGMAGGLAAWLTWHHIGRSSAQAAPLADTLR